MALLDGINDKCWDMLDWLWDRHIPIGAAFEKLKLPPVLFPLGIILVVLLLFWFIMMPQAVAACGDGNCIAPGETCGTCPVDCGECPPSTSGLILTVEVVGQVSEPVTVELYGKDDDSIASVSDRKAIFEFPNMESQTVKAKVTCPNGKEQTSRPKTITSGDSTIRVALPDGCFNYITGSDDQPLQTFGNIIVAVADIDTGEPIEASVTAVRGSDDLPEGQAVLATDGIATLNVRSDNFYYLIATKAGYESYEGSIDKFYMLAGDSVYKNIQMKSLGLTAPAEGTLRVCARSGNAPLATGRVSVAEIGGSELEYAFLTQADAGCVTFQIPAGKNVRSTVTSPPPGCISPAFSNTIMIASGSQQQVNLPVTCGDPAYVKVIVHDSFGNALTDQVKVTLWNAVTKQQIPGTAADSSLSLDSGDYTEEVSVPANTLIQAKATGAPIEYVDMVSGPAAFSPNEHGSIDIILGEKSRGEFSFLGASIVYTPAMPGSPIKVFVQQILFNQTVLTNENSEVVMIINGETYDATYASQ